jgi:serine phosphatase RsbU (regulator of sigma subunit)/ABC-type amino acid transport substrate-binding protein
MKKICFLGLIIAFFLPKVWAQTSWRQASQTGKAFVLVHYFNFEPFCYRESGGKLESLKGLEYELFQEFIKYARQKYQVEIIAQYHNEPVFTELYKKIKNGSSGMFALSSLSITEERLKEIKFSPPYLPDIEVLISSNNVPIVRDTIEFIDVFRSLKAVTVPQSTYEKNTKSLTKYLKNLKIENVNHFDDINVRVANEPNLFAYSQLSSYLLERKKGIALKRQNLFKVQKIGHAIAFPLKSDWDEPIQAFFQEPNFKPMMNKIIRKYFGNEVNDLIWSVASDKNTEGNKSLDLLSLESQFQQLDIERKQLEITRQTWLRNSFLVGLVVFLGFTFLLYNRYNLKQKSNKLLSQKNTEIEDQKNQLQASNEALTLLNETIKAQHDAIEIKNQQLDYRNQQISQSMNAARTIQRAMLPYTKRMQATLKDYFVVYRPKDVVSGDFYWLNKIDDKIIVAALDCTGHGIPGAFMSMIGNTLLDKIIILQNFLDPKEILNHLHDEVRYALKQEETGNKDGMDLGLAIIEEWANDKLKITYCGAKRPLYCIDAHNLSQLIELKGNPKSIGGFQSEHKHFENQEVIVAKDSLIYLSTDGYTDQNNVYRKKLGEERLKEALLKNCTLSLPEQQKILEDMLDEHQVGTQQRDDILVWGIRI